MLELVERHAAVAVLVHFLEQLLAINIVRHPHFNRLLVHLHRTRPRTRDARSDGSAKRKLIHVVENALR